MVGWVSREVGGVNGTAHDGGVKYAVLDGNRIRATRAGATAVPPHAPRVATVDRGEETGMRATPLTHHTIDLSYVSHEISQIVSRFVQ